MIPATSTDSPMSFNPGGAMVPATPYTEPAPTPMTANPGGPMNPPRRREEEVGGCTTTISETIANPCLTFDGAETVYPSVATSTAYVDCHGCQHVEVDRQLWYCPVQVINATKSVHTAKTTWTTACATAASQLTALDGPTPKPSITTRMPVPTPQPITPTAQGKLARKPQSNWMEQQAAACPTTYVVQPEQSAGSTSTRYQQIVTSTVKLSCGGCSLVLSTALVGYGPAGRFTATVTAPVRTTTTYACQ